MSSLPVFGMESSDSSRRHRRRGRHSKKKQHYSIDNLRPGRAPVGLPNSMNTTHLETESEDSDAELPPEIPSIHARLHRLLNSTKIQCHGSESKTNQLLSKDMSGLGAQARAAEYAAATAARARQVSREAEDQKLPPKAAPVSLSALAKAQPTSRNKGPKAWKPLNLDEIAESSDDGSTGKDSERDTPANSGLVMLEWTSDITNRQASTSSKRIAGIKVKIPTAPRSMTNFSVPPTVIANPSPQRRQIEPAVKLPLRHSTQDIYLSRSGFGHGGFPYPAMSLKFSSRRPYLLVDAPTSHESAHFQRFGSMMVPSDLSPTKQQQKFAMLGQLPHSNHTSDPVEALGEGLLPPRTVSCQSPSYHERLNNFNAAMTGETYSWDLSVENGAYIDYSLHRHPLEDHIEAGYGSNGEGEVGEDGFYRGTVVSGHAMVQAPYGTTLTSYTLKGGCSPSAYHAHISTIPGAAYQYGRSSAMSTSETQPQPNPGGLEQEEPYDRKSNMQRFVAEATHEALARKGKTVLHNPDLYKERHRSQQNTNPVGNGSNLSSAPKFTDNRLDEVESRDKCYRPVPWDVRPRVSDGNCDVAPPAVDQSRYSMAGLPPGLRKAEPDIITNAVSASANRLGVAQFAPDAKVSSDSLNAELPGQHLHLIDQVGSKEWAKFRPITSTERERVRACMAKAAADLAPKIVRPGLFDDKGSSSSSREEDLKLSREWFYSDFRGERAFRAQLPAITEKHAALRKAAARHANGGSLPTNFKLGIDDGVAANFIMGEVIANLSTYVVGDRKSAEQRRNFHKIKSVPEFATERGGGSGGSGSSDSYFDDDEAGFQGAPVRIARDPRFRPQGKEGLKLKPEEEWKNRHEMYGRRVL